MKLADRFDFSNLINRASTWLAIMSVAAAGGLGAYAVMPERAQLLLPDWTLLGLGAIAMVSGILVPVATSWKQKYQGRTTEVVVTKETRVSGDVSPADATKIAESVQKGETHKP